jgi:hypothetical protein
MFAEVMAKLGQESDGARPQDGIVRRRLAGRSLSLRSRGARLPGVVQVTNASTGSASKNGQDFVGGTQQRYGGRRFRAVIGMMAARS